MIPVSSESIVSCIAPLICMCLYFIGFYYHFKVIKVSKDDKHQTWTLNIAHHCIVIIQHTQLVIMHGITLIVPDVSKYSGKWFCYAMKFITYYLRSHVVSHSFMIASLKYILIVWWEKARDFGHDKIKKFFFGFSVFVYPTLMIILHHLSIPDFLVVYDGYSQLHRCLGGPENEWGINSTRSKPTLHSLCLSLNEPSPDHYIEYIIFLLRSSICWIQFGFLYLMAWNCFETLIYQLTFQFISIGFPMNIQ